MKLIQSVCLSLVLAAAGSRVQAESFRTDINPALIYYRAFLMEPPTTEAERNYLFTNSWRGQPLPDQVIKLISAYTNSNVRLWTEAAAQTVPCDWGIDMSPGPGTLLPELAYCKRAAQIIRLQVMWKLQQGDEAGARDLIITALHLSRNSSSDGTLIAMLVQYAIGSIVISTVAENFNHFSPATLQQIADGFAAAPPQRPVVDALPAEEILCRNWLLARLQDSQKEHPGDDAAALEATRRIFVKSELSEETNFWTQITNASGGTLAGLTKLIDDCQATYDQLPGLLTLPHGEFESRIETFNEAIKMSGNPLAALSVNTWPSSRRKEFMAQAQLAMLNAAIACKLHGEEGLKSVNDPFGNGPFTVERFIFQGEDRGFQLISKYAPLNVPEKMIFVEKDGAPFYVFGPHAGEAVTP